MESSKKIYLLAIKAPGNIEKDILSIKYRIFRKYGNVSSIMFNPFLPLKFLDKKPENSEIIKYKSISKAEFKLTDICTVKNFLYINCSSVFLKDEITENSSIDIFPCFKGFFLGEKPDNFEEFEIKELKWKNSYLSLYKFTWNKDPLSTDLISEEEPVCFSGKSSYNQKIIS